MDAGWPFGPYPPGGLEPLGPHVTAYHAGGFPLSNSAIVRGREGTLVFDPNCFRFARELRAGIEGMGERPRWVIVSHAHDDHTMGTVLFSPPALVTAHARARDRLQRNVEEGYLPGLQYRDGYPGAEREARGVKVLVPQRTVASPTTMELGGGVQVHLFPEEPAHTDGDLWAFVEPDGIALCGDLWYSRCEPYVGSGSVHGSLRALARIRDARPGRCLPGHGPAGTIAPAGEDPVERHLRWVLDEAARAVDAGLTGRGLRERVRRRFEDRRARPGGAGFAVEIPGFLEVTASAAERDVRAGDGG